MAFLTGRRLSREMMDAPDADRAELDAALAWLRGLNRRMGGIAAVINPLQTWSADWPRDRAIRILDIGTGSADIPLAIEQWARRRGARVQITAIDNHPLTIELARQNIEQSRKQLLNHAVGALDAPLPPIALLQANALRLTNVFAPGEFDYAHAGLFLHHLDDVGALTVLTMMDRLTSRGMIWNDLLRGWAGRFGVRALSVLTRMPRMVRHDAIASVEAGFTKREAMEMINRAGWKKCVYQRRLLHRFSIVCNK